jgi:hypothetical protein
MKRAKPHDDSVRSAAQEAFDESRHIAAHGAKWAFALTLIVFFTYASVAARATTPPCTLHKSCVVERTHIAQRSALESDGVRDALADSIADRSSDARYWLRCWQRGVLITERITKTLPPESKRVSEITGPEDNAIKVFDSKNAMCMIERLPSER